MDKSLTSLLVFLFMFMSSHAQDTDLHAIDLNDPDQITLLELESNLSFMMDHKINLNTEDLSSLIETGMISNEGAAAIIEHIKNTGPLLHLLELQSVKGMNLSEIRMILPYVYVNPPGIAPDKKIKHTISLSTSFRNSATEDTLQSSMLLRYRGNAGTRFKWGYTAENDGGEKFTLPGKYGPDYHSGFIEININKRIRKLIAGDYQVGMGQGLTVWNTYARNSSTDLVSLKRISAGIKPNTGRNENSGFKGIAADLRISRSLSGIFYASIKHVDAKIEFDETANRKVIVSFPNSGYHRTEAELESRKTIISKSIGSSLKWEGRRTVAGVNFIYTDLEYPMSRSHSSFNNRPSMTGRSNLVMSIYYQKSFYNMDVFGESAVSDFNACSFIHGILVSAGSRISLALQHNYFNYGFFSFYQNTTSTFKKSTNEEDLQLNTEIRISNRLVFNGLIRESKPLIPDITSPEINGRLDYRASLKFTASKKSQIRVSMAGRNTNKLIPLESNSVSLINQEQITTALFIDQVLTERIIIGLCTQGKQLKADAISKGVLMSVTGKIIVNPDVSLTGGVSTFDTEEGIQLSVFESSTPGSTGIYAVRGNGQRTFIAFNMKLPYRLKFQGKASLTKNTGGNPVHTVTVHLAKSISS